MKDGETTLSEVPRTTEVGGRPEKVPGDVDFDVA